MKGIVVDCKTGKTEEVDDGLPMPEMRPFSEPEGVDLQVVAQKLKEFDELKAELEEIKKGREPNEEDNV